MKNVNRRYAAVLAWIVSMMVALATGSAQKAGRAVQAEQVTTYLFPDGTQREVVGRYYRSADGRVAEEGPMGTVIVDARRLRVTVLDHRNQEARVLTLPASTSRDLRPTAPRLEPTGNDVLEGFTVSKSRLSLGGLEHEVWTADDLGLTVYSKMSSPQGLTVIRQLRRLETTEPAPKVFLTPPGYRIREEAADPALVERVQRDGPGGPRVPGQGVSGVEIHRP